MLTTFDHLVYLNNLNHSKRAVSSCVTSTPLNLLVTALDGRCDVSCCLLVDACSCLLRSNRCLLVDCFPVFSVLCASAGPSETMRACDQLHLRNPTYQQARTIHYL